MSNVFIAFVLTFISGFSTMLGTLLIFLKIKKKEVFIASTLSFAASVMISISIIDLIPESIKLLTYYKYSDLINIFIIFIFMILGIIISSIIDKQIDNINKKNINNNFLFKTGILSMITIIIHNIPEGIATFMATSSNITLGISLTIAIALHNIPEGISISVPLYYSTKNKKKAIFYTFISALSEPFGALIAYLFLANIMTNFTMSILFAIISGIMLNISYCELLKRAKTYNCPKYVTIFFILGIIFSLLQFI